MGGWAQRLVTVGAGAFLAPMGAVSDDAALTFAARFYEEAVRKRVPLGQAVRRVREAVREAHPGDPHLSGLQPLRPSQRPCGAGAWAAVKDPPCRSGHHPQTPRPPRPAR